MRALAKGLSNTYTSMQAAASPPALIFTMNDELHYTNRILSHWSDFRCSIIRRLQRDAPKWSAPGLVVCHNFFPSFQRSFIEKVYTPEQPQGCLASCNVALSKYAEFHWAPHKAIKALTDSLLHQDFWQEEEESLDSKVGVRSSAHTAQDPHV